MGKRIRQIGGAVLFVAGAILLVYLLSQILMDKSTYGTYKNYCHQDNVDVLIVGSSHSMSGFGAADMEKQIAEKTGQALSVFNYSVYGMRIEQMYYLVKEIYKIHTPKLLIIETFSFLENEKDDDEVLARKAFDYLPYSKDKMDAVKACANPQKEEEITYQIPLFKYHTRWKELDPQDFEDVFDKEVWSQYGRAYMAADDALAKADDYFEKDMNTVTGELSIGETSEEKLQELLAFAKEKGTRVLFVSIPYKIQMGLPSENLVQMNYYVKNRYVDGEQVRLLDLNLYRKELDFGYSDLYDDGHCNKKGAKKVTAYVADYIAKQYQTLGEGEGKQ